MCAVGGYSDAECVVLYCRITHACPFSLVTFFTTYASYRHVFVCVCSVSVSGVPVCLSQVVNADTMYFSGTQAQSLESRTEPVVVCKLCSPPLRPILSPYCQCHDSILANKVVLSTLNGTERQNGVTGLKIE